MSDFLAGLRRQSQQRVTDAKARYSRWAMKHGDRLAKMHPEVATEVRSTVMDRFYSGTEGALAEKDISACKMRVASRIRVKQYGRCTEDEEAARQLRAVLAAMAEGGKREAA